MVVAERKSFGSFSFAHHTTYDRFIICMQFQGFLIRSLLHTLRSSSWWVIIVRFSSALLKYFKSENLTKICLRSDLFKDKGVGIFHFYTLESTLFFFILGVDYLLSGICRKKTTGLVALHWAIWGLWMNLFYFQILRALIHLHFFFLALDGFDLILSHHRKEV